MFGDTPSQPHFTEHDIEMGGCKTEPFSSSWASPCLLVPKSDNTLRFCSDFHGSKVNSVTMPDVFSIPWMDDCIDQAGSAKFVSKFDLLRSLGSLAGTVV